MKKKFSSFFHVSDDSEQLSKNFQKIFENFSKFFSGGGVTKGQKFFFRFLAELGHSESILIFSEFLQNRSDRGGDQKSSFAILPSILQKFGKNQNRLRMA